MDKLEMESKIIELGQSVITLEDMIAENQQVLSENKEAVAELMAELGVDEVKDALEEVRVVRTVTKSIRFDSKAFKKANPDIYEEYRVESKTFKQKLLKEEKPELFNEFVNEEEDSFISIERYIEEDSLPSI